MTKKEFSHRLRELRELKGISGREMSSELGQSPGYVNNIENGIIYPSMQMFFVICQYFNMKPEEFFLGTNMKSGRIQELSNTVDDMTPEQLDVVLSVARMIQVQSCNNKFST